MVRTAALTYGAQGGLAARSFAINEMLRRYQAQLDSAYDFRALVLPVGAGQTLMRPPIVSAAQMAFALGDSGQVARETSCIYQITREAQLASAPPNWRTYLVRSWSNPRRPTGRLPCLAPSRRPPTGTNGWRRAGRTGRSRPSRSSSSDLGRLERDIVGMARYRVLLRAGLVEQPTRRLPERPCAGRPRQPACRRPDHPHHRSARPAGQSAPLGAGRRMSAVSSRAIGQQMLDGRSTELGPVERACPLPPAFAGRNPGPTDGICAGSRSRARHAPGLDSPSDLGLRVGASRIAFQTGHPVWVRIHGRNHRVTRARGRRVTSSARSSTISMAPTAWRGCRAATISTPPMRSRSTARRGCASGSTRHRRAPPRRDGGNIVLRPIADMPPPLEDAAASSRASWTLTGRARAWSSSAGRPAPASPR